MTLDHVVEVLRCKVGVAHGHVPPRALARALNLELVPRANDRTRVVGDELRFDDTQPMQMQLYLIARAASAHALKRDGLLREHSPHDVAVALCGVSCALAVVPERPRVPPRRRVISVIKVRPLGHAMEA